MIIMNNYFNNYIVSVILIKRVIKNNLVKKLIILKNHILKQTPKLWMLVLIIVIGEITILITVGVKGVVKEVVMLNNNLKIWVYQNQMIILFNFTILKMEISKILKIDMVYFYNLQIIFISQYN